MRNKTGNFRQRLLAGDPLMGTFIKTPSPVISEVLGLSALDVIAIDSEHAPFGRVELDLCIAAFRAADMPCLVRVADDSPTVIRNALDSGATGIIVPHVTSAEQAAAVVKAAHFGEGGRGYAGSSRAAGYTTKSMADHIADNTEHTVVIVQIEDIAALDHVAQIAAVDGVDCLFVGRADLAVAMQKGVAEKDVIATVQDICAAGQSQGTPVGMFTPNLDEIPDWRNAGASLFLLSSDQSLLLAGANELAQSKGARPN
ncbi:MAG: aldolase/citrate lyase family protein [Gammaproteobacteria bacterium]|nr:aldolase/citrate lyase family protein [Gammaproteobacteria bacterium]